MIELLTNNHLEKILDLFDGANRDIRIISPFLSVAMAQRLCDSIRERGLRCAFITRFYIEDMVAKANSIDALEMLLNAGVDLYAVKRLHTKLYLFDHDQAIVGSANFTTGGFKSNIELLHPGFETSGRTPPHRKVWTDAPGIFKRSPPIQIEYIDTDRRIVDISCRHERTGTGTVRHYHGTAESCRGRDRGIKAYLSNGMGAALQ